MLHGRRSPERLSGFCDGVFAVLITVLVLDLRPPEFPTFKSLLSLWPTWLSYLVSYLFIAIVWTNHHHLMRYATEATPNLVWFNFAHLFSVSLLPLATAWMAVSELAPQPVAFYAGVRRETGKEYEVKVLYGEGYAHHTGPEPCGVDREVGGEASAGGGVGQPLSRERQVIPGADDVPASEGNTNRREPSAGTVWPGVVLDPGMRSSSLRGNREVSCPSGARMRRRIASGRRGAVADDERAGEVRTPP